MRNLTLLQKAVWEWAPKNQQNLKNDPRMCWISGLVEEHCTLLSRDIPRLENMEAHDDTKFVKLWGPWALITKEKESETNQRLQFCFLLS